MRKYVISYLLIAIVCAFFATVIVMSFIELRNQDYNNPVSEAVHWALIGALVALSTFFVIDTIKEFNQWRSWMSELRTRYFVHSDSNKKHYEEVITILRNWRLRQPDKYEFGKTFGMDWIIIDGKKYTTDQDSWLEFYSDFYVLNRGESMHDLEYN